MARIRSIKPSFFTDDEVGALPMAARLLFAGLWCLADREGRLKDRPRRIKVEVLPYDDVDVDALLDTLHDAGFICRYDDSGEALIAIENFKQHQYPHVKEPPSDLPPPPSTPAPRSTARGEHHASTVLEPGPNGAGTSLRPSQPVGHGNGHGNGHGKGRDTCPTNGHVVAPDGSTVVAVFDAWKAATGRNGTTRLTPKRRRCVQARLKDGYSVEELISAVRGVARSPFHLGENDRHQRFDDLTLILRDGEHVEKFRDLERGDGPPDMLDVVIAEIFAEKSA